MNHLLRFFSTLVLYVVRFLMHDIYQYCCRSNSSSTDNVWSVLLNLNRTASAALCDAVHTLYRGSLYPRIVKGFILHIQTYYFRLRPSVKCGLFRVDFYETHEFSTELCSYPLHRIAHNLNVWEVYEDCPESIQPFWISREPVPWPRCILAASRRRPWCVSVNSHRPMGLVSRQWDAIDWVCFLCDCRIHNDRASRSAPSQCACLFYRSHSGWFLGKASHHPALSATL